MPVGFFDADYRRILAPFYDETATRSEVATIRELVGLAQQDAVIDLGCGWGRHLVHLHQVGHEVVGLDLSLALLGQVGQPEPTASSDRSTEHGDSAAHRDRWPLICGDLRWLPLAPAVFDVALHLNSSAGLFLDDESATRALGEARRVLRPGGRLLVEGMHRDEAVARYASADRWRLEDGTEVRARRRFDPRTGISEERLRWRTDDGGIREKRHRLRLRTGTEQVSLVERAGLEVRSVWGDWDGRPFRRLSPRLILLAERPVS